MVLLLDRVLFVSLLCRPQKQFFFHMYSLILFNTPFNVDEQICRTYVFWPKSSYKQVISNDDCQVLVFKALAFGLFPSSNTSSFPLEKVPCDDLWKLVVSSWTHQGHLVSESHPWTTSSAIWCISWYRPPPTVCDELDCPFCGFLKLSPSPCRPGRSSMENVWKCGSGSIESESNLIPVQSKSILNLI